MIPMLRRRLLITLIVLAMPTAAAAQPRAAFTETAFEFGKAVRGARVEHEFVLQNEGSEPLRIQGVRMTKALSLARVPAQIEPGGQVALKVSLDTTVAKGAFKGKILLSLNDPALPEAQLVLAGRVVAPVEVAPQPALFLAVHRGESRRAAIEIINHEPVPLTITAVEHASDRFSTSLEAIDPGQRYRLTMAMKGEGVAGKRQEIITLRTSSQSTPVLKLGAFTNLVERVYTFPDTVDLGALRLPDIQAHPDLLQRTAQTLMVYQRGGTDFKVGAKAEPAIVDLKSERGPAGDRHQFTVTLIKEKIGPGPIKGTITIETNDAEFPKVTVPFSGVILL